MKIFKLSLMAVGMVMVTVPPVSAKELIDHHQFTLGNGLRVIVHEDHKSPKVAVHVWYHVGSKDEPTGKSGFAHLFEHLMFNGSENHDDEYFPPLQEVGASEVNGTTWLDRTNYYETVPTGALERILWLESDRMGHLLGAITQEKLDEQRSVVQNEKRTGDNRPYGMMAYHVMEGVFPENHPYHHSTIGSMDDLNNASLEDVKSWFRQYYGAANAVVVLSGDVTLAKAKTLTQKYFGHIDAGPPVSRITSWVPDRAENTSEIMLDNVSQKLIAWTWAVPGLNRTEGSALRIAASILGQGKMSRLHKVLVHDLQLATSAFASYSNFEIAGTFGINIKLKDGADPQKVENIVKDVLDDFLKNGPTRKELKRVKTSSYGDMVKAFESISIKARVLAQGALYSNDPGEYVQSNLDFERTTAKEVRDVSKLWLTKGYHKLTVVPYGKHPAVATPADRAEMPAMTEMSALKLPELSEGRLSNGIRVVFSRRTTIPAVELSMVFDGGGSADQYMKDGVDGFTLGLMNEGTRKYSSLELAEEQALLGARVFAYANADKTIIALSALKKNLVPSMELWADFVRNPAFREEDLERDRALSLSALAQSLTNPGSIAWGTFSHLLYGKDHAYGTALANRADTINSYTRDDVILFHESWIRPDNATIYVVGDTTLNEIAGKLEKIFGNWKAPKRAKGTKKLEMRPLQKKSRLILVDKPGAIQSAIRAGHLMPNGLDPRDFRVKTMNALLGGGFTARMNMNLREDKGWTYGANSSVSSARGQQLFVVNTNVQTDKTAASMKEIMKEIRDFRKDRPATEAELDIVVKGKVLALPGRFETNWSLLSYLQYIDRFNKPYDHITRLADMYGKQSPKIILETAQKMLRPDALTWVIVGDLKKIEQNIRKLNFANVEIWDAEGQKIR